MRIPRVILLSFLILTLAFVAGAQISLAAEDGLLSADLPAKHPKFGSSIAQLAEAGHNLSSGVPMNPENISKVWPGVQAYLKAGLLRLDQQGRVQVYINASQLDESTLTGLKSAGVEVERTSDSRGLVQGSVSLKALSGLAELDYVKSVTAPSYGRVDVGSRLTQGDALLGLAELRAALGVDGTGVTVGVVSDGIAGLQTAITSGDLPQTNLVRDATGKLVATDGGIIATSFHPDGLEAGAEGTAILEIIHDIAPGAQLRFANGATGLDFNDAVNFLAANSDVVIDDIGFLVGPFDQSGPISSNTAAALNSPANPIRGYYTSVGNQALRHYEEMFVPNAHALHAAGLYMSDVPDHPEHDGRFGGRPHHRQPGFRA